VVKVLVKELIDAPAERFNWYNSFTSSCFSRCILALCWWIRNEERARSAAVIQIAVIQITSFAKMCLRPSYFLLLVGKSDSDSDRKSCSVGWNVDEGSGEGRDEGRDPHIVDGGDAARVPFVRPESEVHETSSEPDDDECDGTRGARGGPIEPTRPAGL
jgi:hypothetical protein